MGVDDYTRRAPVRPCRGLMAGFTCMLHGIGTPKLVGQLLMLRIQYQGSKYQWEWMSIQDGIQKNSSKDRWRGFACEAGGFTSILTENG